MDSSQSPGHNGINATTQESMWGEKKILYSTPLSKMFARDPKVCEEKKKKKKKIKKEAQKVLQNRERNNLWPLQIHYFLT